MSRMPNGGDGLGIADDGQLIVVGDRCPRCHGGGVLGGVYMVDGRILDPKERWTARPCSCDYAARGAIAIAGFPHYLDGKTLANFDWSRQEAKHKAVSTYVESLGSNISAGVGLMLIGGVGTGKTHIAVAIGRLVCQQVDWGDRVLFANVPALLREIKQGYSQDDDREQIIMRRLAGPIGSELVILDDMAAEKSTDWAADTLYSIVNTRYENMQATIITANVTLDTLKQRVGERIVSRLYERCVVVDMGGDDYRVRIRKQGQAAS
jgi:DNA replication protein DnaC